MEAKKEVRIALAKLGMTQGQLAAQLGIQPQSLSRVLNVPVVNTSSHWPAILEALGLEVIVQPKQQP